jgi:hypothetical protein
VVVSKRERYILIATVAVVGLLILDWFIVGPLLARKKALDVAIEEVREKQHRGDRIMASARRATPAWNQMVQDRLKKDASEAESQVLHSVRDWAQDAGMSLSSMKPERTEKDKEFVRTSFRATGVGGMAQISRFLWNLQSSDIPIRITDLQIVSRKDGTDELSLQLGMSTTWLAPPPPEKIAGPGAKELLP